MNAGVLPTPEDVLLENLEVGRGWSLRVISSGTHSLVGELVFRGVAHADLLAATRRGDIPRASLHLRPGVRFEFAGSIGGFDLRKVVAEVGIALDDHSELTPGDGLVPVDIELVDAVQNALTHYFGGPVAITPFGSDDGEPLIVFDIVNDVRPNPPTD